MPKYLLDADTCIAVMRNHPKAVQRLAAVSPSDCAISSITAFELYTGIEKCAQPDKERAKVTLLLSSMHLLPYELAAATEAARVRALLESQGQPIGA